MPGAFFAGFGAAAPIGVQGPKAPQYSPSPGGGGARVGALTGAPAPEKGLY